VTHPNGLVVLRLRRTERTADGVFGTLAGPGFVLHTMEDDWRGNKPRVSCIPAGVYPLRRTIYYRHGYETFEIANVPGRSRILIHPANTEEDVEGCVGVGLRRGFLRVPVDEDTGALRPMKRAVVASRDAFRLFMSKMIDHDAASITVEWDPAVDPVQTPR
jgi:hypothetical protein